MDAPIELHDIMDYTTSVVDENTYETPVASRDEENEYMKIDTVAERMTTSRTTRDKPTRNVDGVDVSKPSTDAYALRKVQIFCLILLVMLVISSATIGVLINMMMQRTDELQLKISELQNRSSVLTGNESANIQELQSKVIQLEKDRSFDTSMIQDHGSRITKLEINMSTAEDNIQSQGARMYVTIDDNQRRISRVELDNNATGSLYQTMEARLTYLEDGLNCTWGDWTSFTSCSATCGDGIQYRERSLEGMDTENSRQLCAKKEIDIQTCIIKPCKDCSGFTAGDRIDGVYNISPNKSLTESVPVYCEFSSDGAWTVIQKRYDGSVDFSRTWQEYKAGFGDVNGEYWLGNEAIHEITSRGTYRLKVRLTDWDNVTKFATYTTFRISNELDNYRLTIGEYSGDSMRYNDGYQFSTHDRDNDVHSSYNCAEWRGKGGWWYRKCTYANLNGVYHHTPNTTDATGIHWRYWHGWDSLKATTMMIQT